MNKNQRGSALLVVILIIVIVFAVVVGVWSYESGKQSNLSPASPAVQNQSTTPAVPGTNTTTTTQKPSNETYTINSIFPASGPIGTEVTVTGNFSGLEYATVFHFESEASGQNAIIDFMPSNQAGGFIVRPAMCTSNIGASGLACPVGSSMLVTPGKYIVYFENLATNEVSNKTEFTVTP